LILQKDLTRAAVFLAGGIGITPFRSTVQWAAKDKLPHRIVLFYSNRRPEDAAFLAQSFRAWRGETGLIDQGMLGRYLKGAASPIYYIAGPPAMVKGLHEMLSKAGMNDSDIRAEEFAGY
jgi:ferredoxin-NADP reductase